MGGEAKGNMYTCMVYKVENVHIQLRIIIKFPENPSITLFFYLYGV